MNETLRKKLAKKHLERMQTIPKIDVLFECFDLQKQFILNPAKRKVLCLTRRAGKSSVVAIYLTKIALENPNTTLLYVNTSEGEAKNVIWPILRDLFIKLNIKANLLDSDNEIRFDNGSIIYLYGIDSSQERMNILRGKKYALAVIDECQSYRQDLKKLINQVLGPTLADANATLCLIGTPGDRMGKNYWYQINRKDSEEKGWTFFHWTWQDNPHVRDNMQKHIDDLIAADPLVINTPYFRQEYKGEWVALDDSRVYQSKEYNYTDFIPVDFHKNAYYILSIDLGYFPDPTAFCVIAYNKLHSNMMYVLESKKMLRLTFDEVANEIKVYRSKYYFKSMVVDAANRQGVETIKRNHNLPLLDADKLGKTAHISAINSDFITKHIEIVKDSNQELISELSTLLWDANSLEDGKRKEDGKFANHLCDALLYGHHGSRHYWYKTPVPVLSPENAMREAIEKQFDEPKNQIKSFIKPFWENNDI